MTDQIDQIMDNSDSALAKEINQQREVIREVTFGQPGVVQTSSSFQTSLGRSIALDNDTIRKALEDQKISLRNEPGNDAEIRKELDTLRHKLDRTESKLEEKDELLKELVLSKTKEINVNSLERQELMKLNHEKITALENEKVLMNEENSNLRQHLNNVIKAYDLRTQEAQGQLVLLKRLKNAVTNQHKLLSTARQRNKEMRKNEKDTSYVKAKLSESNHMLEKIRDESTELQRKLDDALYEVDQLRGEKILLEEQVQRAEDNSFRFEQENLQLTEANIALEEDNSTLRANCGILTNDLLYYHDRYLVLEERVASVLYRNPSMYNGSGSAETEELSD